MNFLGKDDTADYIVTGAWSKKAVKEAERFGHVHVAGTSAAAGTDAYFNGVGADISHETSTISSGHITADQRYPRAS